MTDKTAANKKWTDPEVVKAFVWREGEEEFIKNYPGNFHSDAVEQYKIYYDSAYKEVGRYDLLYHFFFSLDSLNITGLGACFINFNGYWIFTIILSVFGIIISSYWKLITDTAKLRVLNKFGILFSIEENLPLRMLKYEFALMQNASELNGKLQIDNGVKFTPFVKNEDMIPTTFSIIYASTLLFTIIYKITKIFC